MASSCTGSTSAAYPKRTSSVLAFFAGDAGFKLEPASDAPPPPRPPLELELEDAGPPASSSGAEAGGERFFFDSAFAFAFALFWWWWSGVGAHGGGWRGGEVAGAHGGREPPRFADRPWAWA